MVAQVYGRWVSAHQERDQWERAAATLDVEQFGARLPENLQKIGPSKGYHASK